MAIKEYWQELATKAGIPQERINAVAEALGDDATAKAFQNGFVTRSDYSRDLDKTRDEWKSKAEQAEATKAQYDKWYAEQAAPVYKDNLARLQKLQKYEEMYGAIDDNGSVTKREAAAVGMTKAELEQLIDERSGARDQRVAGIIKGVNKLSMRHYKTFGEEPDLDAIEKIAVEQGLNLDSAYDKWVQPQAEKRREAEQEARDKRVREEAIRDYASKHKLPVEAKPRDSHVFFDRHEVDTKNPRGQEQAAKTAFLDALNDPNWREAPAK